MYGAFDMVPNDEAARWRSHTEWIYSKCVEITLIPFQIIDFSSTLEKIGPGEQGSSFFIIIY